MSTIYISISGSDSTGDGTISAPFLSIDKAYDMANTSDIIHLLSGTYNVYTTLNVTKPLTFTGTDAIINGTGTVFNIQTNDVHINNLTIESSHLTNPVISIDRNSTGSTVPTYYTGNSITYCTIRYTVKGLYLNGTYTIDHNNFRRCTGTYSAHVISIYSSRGICSISNNTVLDSEHIQYVIYLTSSGSGSFLDLCNSKIGALTIQDNNIFNNCNDVKCVTLGTVTKIIYYDYFNTYFNTLVEDYNFNTKLGMVINNNTISSKLSLIFIELCINNNLSYNMFDRVVISNNTINYTFNGIVTFNKLINSSTYTINSYDLNRPIFSVTANTAISTGLLSLDHYKIIHIDVQLPNVMTIGGVPVGPGPPPDNENWMLYKNCKLKNIGCVKNLDMVPSAHLNGNEYGLTYVFYPANNSFKCLYGYVGWYSTNIIDNVIESPIFSYILVHKTIMNRNDYPLISIDRNARGYAQLPVIEAYEPEYYIVDETSTNTLRYDLGDSTNTRITAQTVNVSLNDLRIDILVFGETQTKRYLYNKTNSDIIPPVTRTQPYTIPKTKIRLGYKLNIGPVVNMQILEFMVYNKELSSTDIDSIVYDMRTKYNSILP